MQWPQHMWQKTAPVMLTYSQTKMVKKKAWWCILRKPTMILHVVITQISGFSTGKLITAQQAQTLIELKQLFIQKDKKKKQVVIAWHLVQWCETLSLTYHSICGLFVCIISTMCLRLTKSLWSVISGSGFCVFVYAAPTECQTFTCVFFLISFFTVSRHSTSKLTWSECMDFSDTQTYIVSDLESLKRFLNQGLYLRIQEEKVQKIRFEGVNACKMCWDSYSGIWHFRSCHGLQLPKTSPWPNPTIL